MAYLHPIYKMGRFMYMYMYMKMSCVIIAEASRSSRCLKVSNKAAVRTRYTNLVEKSRFLW